MPYQVGGDAAVEEPGVGIVRIARTLGCSHMTVRHHVSACAWVPYHGFGRTRTLVGLVDWIANQLPPPSVNADVVRQELEAEKGVTLSLRMIEREARHYGESWRRKHESRSESRRR